MKLGNILSKIQKLILLSFIVIFIVIGFGNWWNNFFNTYYPNDDSIQGQLFPNIANTKVEVEENIFSFSGVKYEKIIIKIGSLSSEYDDSSQAAKANNIINRKLLDQNFKKWLIKSFNKKEAKKLSDHIEIYYRGIKIKEISY